MKKFFIPLSISIILFLSYHANGQNNELIVSQIGNQKMFVETKMEVFFSTLNNTFDVDYTAQNLPSFAKIESLQKGDGKITFKDIANKIYIDPVNGNNDNDGSYNRPFKTIDRATSEHALTSEGGIIYLRGGNYGDIFISSSNQKEVYITAQRGHIPYFEKLTFSLADNWTVYGIKITPEISGSFEKGVYVNISGGSRNITVKNCEIFGTSDINNWKTIQDWYDYAGDGIKCTGKYCSFKNNIILNTYFAVSIHASNNNVSHNIVNNFGGDAIRGLGNFCRFEYNQIKNATVSDYETGNHDDAFQSWTVGTPVKGLIINGNQITDISYPELPLQTEIMQGIVDFDGYLEDWTIENNLVVIHHPHGISLYGAKYTKIVNNTVVKNPLKLYQPNTQPWIRINNTKKGDPSFGNLTRNNIMGLSFQENYPGTYDHNFVTYDNHNIFVNYSRWNFHLKPNTVCVDKGKAEDAPTEDADNRLRNVGTTDLGCFEYNSNDQDLSQPEKITGINYEKGPEHILLNWTSSNDNFDIKNYHIICNNEHIITDTNQCIITNLFPGVNYPIEIYCEDNAGNYSDIEKINIKTDDDFKKCNYVLTQSLGYDMEINEDSKIEWIFDEYIKIGNNENGRSSNGILIFKIPSIPPKEDIINAELSLVLENIIGTPNGNIDLYALPFKRKPEIGNITFWQGDFDNHPEDFIPIMDDFISKDNTTGEIKTDSIASINILNYYKQQLNNGAHGGDYLIFRLNIDGESENADSYYKIPSGDSKNTLLKPSIKLITDNDVGTDDLADQEALKVYPNPVTNVITIELGEQSAYKKLQVLTLSGKVILTQDIQSKLTRVDVSKFPQGIYFVKIGSEVRKIVVN